MEGSMAGPISCCFLMLALGADPLGEAAKKELKKLEGEWIVKSVETSAGKREFGDELATVTFTGSKIFWFPWKQKGEVVALDPTANPKTLDIKTVRKDREDTVGELIYKIDGDTLILATFKGEGKKRPTSFDKPTDDKTEIWTFTQTKK
jgi:uncharacterized protein (TIGR03067 family)